MTRITEREAIGQVAERLAGLLRVPVELASLSSSMGEGVDAVLQAGGHIFAVEWKGSGQMISVSRATETVRRAAARVGNGALPLVAVPYMPPGGQRLCQEAGVGWLDLSGNADISGPGLRILVQAQPDKFKGPGRPSSVFAPKSSRVSRWLLMHPERPWPQHEIAQETGLDAGYISRTVSRLVKHGLVARQSNGALRVSDPDLLLDAWREAYHFPTTGLLQGHMPARSGELALRMLAEELVGHKIEFAATGLAAAWLLTSFAAFRIATIYLRNPVDASVLEGLGFRKGSRGANVWLAVPQDEGAFQGVEVVHGVPCVHPIQVYLDLKDHPERAREAAEQLRKERLHWRAGNA